MFLSRRSNGVYYLWFTDEVGQRQKVSTGASLKAEATRFLRKFTQKDHERKKAFKPVLLSNFTQEYLDYTLTIHRPSSQNDSRFALNVFLKTVGNKPLHEISFRDIERFLSEKARLRSDRTVRFYYVTLASAFETARRWGHIFENPFRKVEKPKLRELSPAYCTREEFRLLLNVVDSEELRDVYICAVCTGMRLGELSALRWIDVDLDRRYIHVRNTQSFVTKTRRNRTIPINDDLASVLQTRKSHATFPLVFHQNRGQALTKEIVSKGFKRYIRRACLREELHFHSLRHTFASWLVQAGVSLYEVQRLLGHSSFAMTQVYAHLQPEHLHDAVNRLHL